VCDGCGTVNFARRTKCFQCAIERPPNARLAHGGSSVQHEAVRVRSTPNGGAYTRDADDGAAPPTDPEALRGRFDADAPTASLVVYGLSKYSGEADLRGAFRAYAPVKDAKLLRDPASGQTVGVGFVTFFNVESATHAMATAAATKLEIDGADVALGYSRGPAAQQVAASLVARAERQTASSSHPIIPGGIIPSSSSSSSGAAAAAAYNGGGTGHADRGGRPPAASALHAADAPPVRARHRVAAAAEEAVASIEAHRRRRRARSASSGEESDGRGRRSHHGAPHGAPHGRAAAAKKRDWPPSFEEDGAAWAFHDSSGYFYEPASGFYYDPKTKVYYNAHQREYYYHTPGTTPPFTRANAAAATAATQQDSSSAAQGRPDAPKPPPPPPPPRTTTTTTTTTPSAAEDASQPGEPTKEGPGGLVPVIQLGTTKITATSKPGPLGAASKPLAFDLSKSPTTAPAKDAKDAAGAAAASSSAAGAAPPKPPALALSHVLAVGTDYDQLHRLAVNDRPVTRHDAASGKWMCLVSRRQFNDEAHLKKHIAKSQLYKDALEQAARDHKVALK